MADQPSEPVGKLGVTFTRVESSGITPDRNIAIGLRGSDGRLYQIDLSPDCAPLAIVALAQRLGDVQTDEGQLLKIGGIQTAVSDDGSPVLVLKMEEGGDIPLVLESGHITELIRALQQLVRPPDSPTH